MKRLDLTRLLPHAKSIPCIIFSIMVLYGLANAVCLSVSSLIGKLLYHVSSTSVLRVHMTFRCCLFAVHVY